jgi:mono/diheme cytochrome c family protein
MASVLKGRPTGAHGVPTGNFPPRPTTPAATPGTHPMEQLVAITKFGMVPPNAPENYVSDMPAFAGKLNDQQIANVLAWIESQWPAEVRTRRAEMLQRK